MSARLGCVLFLVAVLSSSGDGTTNYGNSTEPFQDGYYLDSLNDAAAFTAGSDTLECPSTNVITTRYKCNMKGEWVDCTRKHCCDDYTFIAGRCVPKNEDPCSMNLCEQQCTIYLQRVICTCYDGFKFSLDNQKKGIKPFCIDINECLDGNGDCEHECVNEEGGFRCECRTGYNLRPDNKTCAATDVAAGLELPALRDRCYANCDTVQRLHDRIKGLQEKVSALSTAIRLSSFASGPPGPSGPAGPPGPQGPRGFPGPEGSNAAVSTQDYTYSILDAFVPLPGDETTQCRCKRGPQGEVGPPGTRGPQGVQGERGPRGPKGEKGSFDFLLLLLADVRHDIVNLQSKIYTNGDKPPRFDFEAVLERKRLKGKHKLLKQYRLLEGFAGPTVEASVTSTTETATGTDAETTDNDEITTESTTEKYFIEEFRDVLPNLEGIDDYDYEFSGELTEEDYL